MKWFADAADPPVVIPVVLITVAVHLALVVEPVEGEIAASCKAPPLPLPIEAFAISRLYLIPHL